MDFVAEYGLEMSKPKIVMTRRGEREVRNAPATPAFWDAWRADKEAVKAKGYSASKNADTGQWEVAHWAETMSAEARAQAHEASRADDAEIDLPVGPGMKLYPFQRAGVAYALKRDGTLIGDEMGLGKTVQAIAFANAVCAKRILVVCPASLLYNWRNEIKCWQTLGLPVTVVRPNQRTFNSQPGWFVVNYDIAGRYAEEMNRQTWDVLVLDECQYLKTRTAQRTVALLGGSRKVDGISRKVEPVPAKKILALTGTPIMNRPAELFPILHRLDPRRWPTWSGFARRYCAGEWDGQALQADGASNLDELNARLRETVLVRRLKKDVMTELPAKTRQIVTLDIDSDEVQAVVNNEVETYERNEAAIAAASTAMLQAEADGDEAAYKSAVAGLKKARAVAFSEMSKVRHETAVAKLPQVIEHLRQTEGKVLVFAHHHDVLDAICEAFADRGVVTIDGRTKNEDRQVLVQRFQTDPTYNVFVGGIKAAGVGLTLTAASHVVFAELDWTPSAMSQAEDRAHRIGQRDSVTVQHLVFDGSLDSKMAKMLVAKQAVIDAALDAKVAISEKAPPVAAEADEPIALPDPAPVVAPKFTEVPSLTPEQVAAIHSALRVVAAYDGDRASQLNGIGFSKMDTEFGCSLAGKSSLTLRQAAAAMKLARKYRRQYPADIYQSIFGVAP